MRTVLVLHGYTQNGAIMSQRLGALRKECGDAVELVFIDAPHILRHMSVAGAAADPSLTPRAWWQYDSYKNVAIGLKESIEFIRDILRTRKFDGVLGFSQGATFAALITALLERPEFYPSFMVDGEAPHPRFQFCIAVSGFRLSDSIIQGVYTPPCSTYSLHVFGKNDVIVPPERSTVLSEVFTNRRVEEHDGGHFIPSNGNWRKFLCNFMKDPFANLPSPISSGGGGGSLGGSMLFMKR